MVAVLVALLVGAAGAAVAQPVEDGEPTTQARLRIEELSGVLAGPSDFAIVVEVTNRSPEPLTGLRIVGTFHRRTLSRFDYQQAVDEGAVGEVWSSFTEDVADLAAGDRARVSIRRSAPEIGFGRGSQTYGVYPLRVQLQHEGASVDDVHTSVVVIGESVETPVDIGLLWPLDALPARQADGTFAVRQRPARALDDVAPGGRLRGLLDAARVRGAWPVTLVPNGLLLDQLAAAADGFAPSGHPAEDPASSEPPDSPAAGHAAEFLEDLAAAAGDRRTGVLAPAYAPGDLVALVRGGLLSEAVRDIVSGREVVAERTGTSPLADVLWPPDGVDEATLEAVDEAGIDTLVLGETHLAIPDGRELPFTPSPVRRLEPAAGGRGLTALVPDPWLERLLARSSEHGPAVASQRLVAETAVVYFERPFAARSRGLLLAPPRLWEPADGEAEALLERLAAAPWLRPVTLPALARGVEPASDAVTLAYPPESRSAELAGPYVADIREARVQLGSLASTLAGGGSAPGDFDDLLRAAGSVAYRSDRLAAEGAAMIGAVTDTVSRVFASVEVVESPAVVLTSVEGQVPVTLQSSAEAPLQVRVRLQSTRFAFDEGGSQVITLEPAEVRTLTFAARALTAGGQSSIRVVVEDPTGGLPLAVGSVVVRSTAYSVVALVVTGAAAAFLLSWWGRELTKRRYRASHRRPRSRRERAESQPRTQATPDLADTVGQQTRAPTGADHRPTAGERSR